MYQNKNYSPAEVTQLRKHMPIFWVFVLEQELGLKQYWKKTVENWSFGPKSHFKVPKVHLEPAN